jgi:uncharacterized membrane protein YhfC
MFHLLLTIALTLTIFNAQTPDPEQDALNLLELMRQRSFEGAWDHFDPVMASRLPPSSLRAVWNENLTSFGEFQQVVDTRVQAVGEYTAVNIRAQFETALVNVRVVYNQSGQVAGLFLYPLEVTKQISPLFTGWLMFSALFAILFPIGLAAEARRRWGVSWKYFFYGVGVFALFQLFTRLPIVATMQGVLGPYLNANHVLLFLWLAALSISAGLFEEFGRYVGFRWMMAKDPKTWAVAVMFGLGHGGFESMVLVGINNLAGTALIFTYPVLANLLPTQEMGLILRQVASYAAAPSWLPLLAAWERLWTIFFHVALAVLVLQVFRGGGLRWLWLAITLHAAGNLLVVGLPLLLEMERQAQYLFSSVLVSALGLLALWIIHHFRAAEAQESARGLRMTAGS